MYIWIFLKGLFIKVKNQKQFKCLSLCKWQVNLRYNHTIQYYSATNKENIIDALYNMGESQKHVEQKKGKHQRLLYNFIYMKLWKRQI